MGWVQCANLDKEDVQTWETRHSCSPAQEFRRTTELKLTLLSRSLGYVSPVYITLQDCNDPQGAGLAHLEVLVITLVMTFLLLLKNAGLNILFTTVTEVLVQLLTSIIEISQAGCSNANLEK